MRSRASGGARERSIAACKSSRTLLCECGGWEAAALCSAQPFLSTMRGFLLTLLTLSMEKEILVYLNFYSETNKNIHMYFRAANTAFVCLIKREYAGWRGSAQLLSAYIGLREVCVRPRVRACMSVCMCVCVC